MSKHSKKPLVVALGAAFAFTGLSAQASVFQAAELGSGYMVASAGDAKSGEMKCGEGKCGGTHKTAAEHKCGEGKCGEAMFKAMDKNNDGSLSKAEFMDAHKGKEGKCGEGKCGEGKCGSKPTK